MYQNKSDNNQRGAALFEFAIVATVFLTMLFGVIEFGRFFWTHNALRDAARKGARYATIRRNDSAGIQAVKYMVVYGNPNANPSTATPIVPGLTASNVAVEYQNYTGVQLGSRTSVSIINYQFQFALPFVGTTTTMPAYRTSLPGESVGYVPCDIGAGLPLDPCYIIPTF